MKRDGLTLLGAGLFFGGLVAWFIEPTRRVDWIPLVTLGVAVSYIDQRVKDIERRLDKLDKTAERS